MLEGVPETDANRQKSLTLMSGQEAELVLKRARRLALDTPNHLLRVSALLDDIFDAEEEPTGTVNTGGNGQWHVAS